MALVGRHQVKFQMQLHIIVHHIVCQSSKKLSRSIDRTPASPINGKLLLCNQNTFWLHRDHRRKGHFRRDAAQGQIARNCPVCAPGSGSIDGG